eukprot:6182534-Pleurochrysis_carterae.AAC.1
MLHDADAGDAEGEEAHVPGTLDNRDPSADDGAHAPGIRTGEASDCPAAAPATIVSNVPADEVGVALAAGPSDGGGGGDESNGDGDGGLGKDACSGGGVNCGDGGGGSSTRGGGDGRTNRIVGNGIAGGGTDGGTPFEQNSVGGAGNQAVVDGVRGGGGIEGGATVPVVGQRYILHDGSAVYVWAVNDAAAAVIFDDVSAAWTGIKLDEFARIAHAEVRSPTLQEEWLGTPKLDPILLPVDHVVFATVDGQRK